MSDTSPKFESVDDALGHVNDRLDDVDDQLPANPDAALDTLQEIDDALRWAADEVADDELTDEIRERRLRVVGLRARLVGAQHPEEAENS